MKAINWHKKFLMGLGLVGSFVVFGSVYQSAQISSTSFMDDTEIKFAKRLDESKERVLASSTKEAPTVAIQYLPVNEENSLNINKQWKVIRIENSEGEEIYNTQKEDRVIEVSMELIKTSQVIVNDDKDYIFDVSFMHASAKTIALFRAVDGGYEVMEAIAIDKDALVSKDKKITKVKYVEEQEESSSEVLFAEAVDMVLERAFVPSIDNRVIVNAEMVRGEVTVGNNSIQGLEVAIAKGEKSLEISVSDIQLEVGGSFVVEIEGVESRGILTSNGKNSYKLRFATGPYKGALLSFVTNEELERITEEKEELERLSEEKSYESSVRDESLEVVQTESSNQRKSNIVNAGYENEQEEQYEEEYSEEESGDEALRQGYSF